MLPSSFTLISHLFSKVKLKLGHKLSQLIHRFNIWILKCWSRALYVSKFFPIHKKRWEIGVFEKPRLHFQIFPNSMKSLKIKTLAPLPSYLVKWWEWSFSTMTRGVKGVLVNLLRKENSWRKSFFQINVEWSSKSLWKMISADVKASKSKNT